MKIFLVVLYLTTFCTDSLQQNLSLASTRRILGGHDTGDTRPYMVYLRPAVDNERTNDWLCGGVIIHERYVLTSAACIEDAKQFYVISGTHRWVPPSEKNDDCINYGAKKAIWKCVPKSYYFDGHEFDNIRWMIKDIAVVKVEDDFNFKRRVKGCDFIPKKIAFNNISNEMEKAGTEGSIAGWGSTDSFGDVISRQAVNSPILLEADVLILPKKNCKSRWDARYHHILDEEMICTKDNMDSDAMSRMCSEQEVNCKELIYSEEGGNEGENRRYIIDPKELTVHTAAHNRTRRAKEISGGFCENDHGGPLIVGRGTSAVVIGIMSACLTIDISHKCHGPFLYTSVWKNRHLISCAIDKEMGATCRRLLRSTKTKIVETKFDWSKSNKPAGSSEPKQPLPRTSENDATASYIRTNKTTRKRSYNFRVTSSSEDSSEMSS